MKKLGWAGLGCYAVHAGFHILNGRPEEALWMCHLGAALVGVGLSGLEQLTVLQASEAGFSDGLYFVT